MSVREYLELVEQIQRVLASQFDPEPEVVEQLHSRFCEAIEQINVRLRRCEELLQDGFRSEALQECERRPHLLESVAALDFPEAPVWSDYATQFGLSPAPELLVEIAADLNDAYLVDSSLEDLMARYRLLNLARSPLKARLSVLQRIAVSDNGNSAWARDLEQFEKARFQELQKELSVAVQKKNLVELSRLYREIHHQPWQTPPPQQLVQQLEKAYQQARVADARRKLQRTAEELNEAFSALDEDKGRSLRQRWFALVELAELKPEDPLWEEVAPAMQWLEEQDTRQQLYQEHLQAVARLEQLLDSGMQDLQQLEKAVYQATKDGFDLPEHLATRVQRRMEAIQLGARRRMRAVVLSVFLVVMLLGGGIGYLVYRQVAARQVEQHVAVVKSLLKQGQLVEAQEHLDRLRQESPAVFQAVAIQQLQAEVRQKLEADARRAAKLEQLLAGVRQVLQSPPNWNRILQARKDLREAQALCKAAEETTEVLRLQQQVRAAEAKLRQEVDARFSQDLEQLIRREQSLPADDPQAVDRLLKEARALKQRPHVSPELTQNGSALHTLISRLEDRLDVARQWQKRRLALGEITQAVGNVPAYKAALQSYARQFPEDGRSKTLEQLAQRQAECWEAVQQWNDFVQKWQKVDVTQLNVVAARNRLQQIEQLKSLGERFPIFLRLYETLAERVDYLKSIVARYDANNRPITQKLIQNWLMRPMMHNLMMLRTKDGTRYYMDQSPRLQENAVVIRYWESVTGRSKRTRTIPLNQVANPRAGSTFLWDSPQTLFVPKCLGLLAKTGPGEWEPSFLKLAEETRKADMDPLLTVFFLKAVLDTGSQGSAVLEQVWKSSRNLIEAASLDPTVNWVNPRDEQAAAERTRARKLLQQLPSSRQTAQEVHQRLQALQKSPQLSRVHWIGWLYTGADKQWHCGLKASRSRYTGTLVVLSGDSLEKPAQWLPVGRIQNGTIHWELNGQEPLLDGMPVFVMVGTSP